MKEIIYIKCLWLDDLEEEVNRRLLDGFVPSGELVIDKEGKYIQAMVMLKDQF